MILLIPDSKASEAMSISDGNGSFKFARACQCVRSAAKTAQPRTVAVLFVIQTLIWLLHTFVLADGHVTSVRRESIILSHGSRHNSTAFHSP